MLLHPDDNEFTCYSERPDLPNPNKWMGRLNRPIFSFPQDLFNSQEVAEDLSSVCEQQTGELAHLRGEVEHQRMEFERQRRELVHQLEHQTRELEDQTRELEHLKWGQTVIQTQKPEVKGIVSYGGGGGGGGTVNFSKLDGKFMVCFCHMYTGRKVEFPCACPF